MAFKTRKFVFKDEEGIIEGNVYYARPNRIVKDKEGNTVMVNGKPLVAEEDIIPFLKKEGYIEVENDDVTVVEVSLDKDEEVKIDF